MKDVALASVREHVKSQLKYGEYYAGGKWNRVNLESVEVMSNGRVSAGFFIPSGGTTIVVTGVRLCDGAGNVWTEAQTQLIREPNIESLYYSMRINIFTESGE